MSRTVLGIGHARTLARAVALLGLTATLGHAQLPCAPAEQWSVSSQSCAMPVLGEFTDDNGDGRITDADRPDVAFWRRDDSAPGSSLTYFVIADAATGSVHVDQPLFSGARLGVAAGDLDGDGEADLVYTSGLDLVCVSDGGAVRWNQHVPVGIADLGLQVGLADLDQDGQPEIHLGHVVWDFRGNHLWTGSRSSGKSPSIAADVDPSSPGMELIVGPVLYAADGRVSWQAATAPEGHTAVADFDHDLEPEIVLLAHEWLGNATLTVLNARGELVGVPLALGARAEYDPVIADLDGDGTPEVVVHTVVGGPVPVIRAFRWASGTLVPFWDGPVLGSDGPTAATAFDFQGDGRSEVVVSTMDAVVVLDGVTGAEIDRLANPSITQSETPVVADADRDGRTEMFSPACGNTVNVLDPSFIVHECDCPCTARTAWNQSSYRIGNVNLDGSIPRFEPPPWLTHDTWGAQAGTGPCDVHCEATVAPPLPDVDACAGESVTLDASGHGFGRCGGTVVRTWTDDAGTPLGTGPTLSVSPLVTTRYRVDVTCSTRPSCRLADAATVRVSERPVLGPATATDVASCNRGVEITWPVADFTTPAGGTYSVYRSDLPGGGTCDEALAAPPLVTGLTDTRWFDTTTLAGITHVWVVEAEDAAPVGSCLPAGPGGGSVARSCTAPLEDLVSDDPPDGVGATLRVERAGADNAARWPDARALLTGEHFHLHRSDSATIVGPIVNGEGDAGREHGLAPDAVPLRFFDLRVANACEQESGDEFPPSTGGP